MQVSRHTQSCITTVTKLMPNKDAVEGNRGVCDPSRSVHPEQRDNEDVIRKFWNLLPSTGLERDVTHPTVADDSTLKNAVFWDIRTRFVLHRRHITSPLQSSYS
jgi:hypothetical protein